MVLIHKFCGEWCVVKTSSLLCCGLMIWGAGCCYYLYSCRLFDDGAVAYLLPSDLERGSGDSVYFSRMFCNWMRGLQAAILRIYISSAVSWMKVLLLISELQFAYLLLGNKHLTYMTFLQTSLLSSKISVEILNNNTQSIKQWNNTNRAKLAAQYPKLAPLVQDEENLTLALNEEYVDMGEVKTLSSGDTVALIPPISGG